MDYYPQDLLEKEIKQVKQELLRYFVNDCNYDFLDSIDSVRIVTDYMVAMQRDLSIVGKEITFDLPVGQTTFVIGEREHERKINIKPQHITAGFGG